MLEKELARLEEELKVLPYGSLRCTSNRGTDQFYVNGNYISKSNYSAPRLGYINFWSKQRKYNFCFIIALLRKVDNFSM